MSNIKIHGFTPSTYVRSARIGALEVELDHELAPLEFRSETHRTLHPFMKMPVLTDGAATVYETLPILAYLEDVSSRTAFFPSNKADRLRNMTACSVLQDYVYEPVVHGEDDDSKSAAQYALDWAESWLGESNNLGGTHLAAADILFAPMLDHHLSSRDASDVLRHRPNLANWRKAMGERPSFKTSAP